MTLDLILKKVKTFYKNPLNVTVESDGYKIVQSYTYMGTDEKEHTAIYVHNLKSTTGELASFGKFHVSRTLTVDGVEKERHTTDDYFNETDGVFHELLNNLRMADSEIDSWKDTPEKKKQRELNQRRYKRY